MKVCKNYKLVIILLVLHFCIQFPPLQIVLRLNLPNKTLKFHATAMFVIINIPKKLVHTEFACMDVTNLHTNFHLSSLYNSLTKAIMCKH